MPVDDLPEPPGSELRTEAFPKAVRLLTGEEYSWVFAKAERSRDQCFTVLARWRGGGVSRLGLAVSKKAVRRAVDRNRVKRTVRESFRRMRQALAGMDVVVVARQGVGQRASGELRRSMNAHWLRLRKVRDRKAKAEHPPQR